MTHPILLFVAAVSILLPATAIAQPSTSIENVKQLAGKWQGWAGNTRVWIVIKEDGNYEGVGAGGRPATGNIVVKDGKALYKSNLSEGEVFLSQEGDKTFLKFVTSGGSAEFQRTK